MSGSPRFTIITTALNCADTLEETIQSVLKQTYPEIEYIVVAGKSNDSTLAVIDRYREDIDKLIFDKSEGIYPALNCGIEAASGEIIGILNSDDLYANDNVIQKAADEFKRISIDALWGDLLYVTRRNTSKVIRYWHSSKPSEKDFKLGWMAPHPALFIRKHIFENYGLYNTSFKFASDYEISLRFFYQNKINGVYVPEIFIKMRLGGRGERNLVLRTFEDYKIAKSYSLNCTTVLLKKILKIGQFLARPRRET